MQSFFKKIKQARTQTTENRFRSGRFQERIRQARNFKRTPRVLPQTRTRVYIDKTRRRWIFILLFVGLILGLISYYLIFSKRFLVREVRLINNTQLTMEQITKTIQTTETERKFGLVSPNHIFFVNREYVQKILSEITSKFYTITVFRKILPNKLEIEIEQKQPYAVWRTDGKDYFIDKQGVVIEELIENFSTSTNHLLLIEASSTIEPVSVMENLNIIPILDYIEKVLKTWNESISHKISFVRIEAVSSREIQVISESGWIAYFDLDREPGIQVKNLALILNQLISKQDQTKLAYVDLRIPEKAYYCLTNDPCAVVEISN